MRKTINLNKFKAEYEARYMEENFISPEEVEFIKDTMEWQLLQVHIALVQLKYSVLAVFGIVKIERGEK
jgi:hypothetical protein